MRWFLYLLAVLLTGCSLNKFVPLPYAGAIALTDRFTGLDASIPYSGGKVGIRFGWGSSAWMLIPVSTNKVYSAPISQAFKLGENLNPFDVTITEDFQSGFEGQAPAPRYNLFSPKK